MQKRLWICLAAIGSLSASGCSSHSVKDGIWELSIRVERSDTREVLEIKKQEVLVAVGWNNDVNRPDVREIMGIYKIESEHKETEASRAAPPQLKREPMFGEIESREEREPFVRIEFKNDKDWIWQMGGVAKDSGTIVGTRFFGRMRRGTNASFEGGSQSWSMRWLRDE